MTSRLPWFEALSVLVFLLLAPGSQLFAASQPTLSGAYDVTVKGSFTGKGTIAVGAKSVTIVLQVTNDAGATGHLTAANLTLTNGRFSGTATVLGTAVTISGRIDAADSKGPVRAASLQATFSGDNVGGRIVGTRRGGP